MTGSRVFNSSESTSNIHGERDKDADYAERKDAMENVGTLQLKYAMSNVIGSEEMIVVAS